MVDNELPGRERKEERVRGGEGRGEEVAFLKYDLQSANELTANTWQVVIAVHCAKNCAPTPVASVSIRNFEVDSSKLWHKTPPLSIETALL